NTRQHLAHGGPMPGLTPKGSTDLICEDLHIHRHRLSHFTRSAERLSSAAAATAATSPLENHQPLPRSAAAPCAAGLGARVNSRSRRAHCHFAVSLNSSKYASPSPWITPATRTWVASL